MIAFFTSNIIMTNLEIIQSTYEGKTSEENAKNLAKYLNKDVAFRRRRCSASVFAAACVSDQR